MKKKRPAKPRRPVVETLEPRILYSADFSPIQLDHTEAAPQAEQRTLDPSGEFTSNATQTHDASVAAQSSRHEVVFVDTAVPDYQKLVNDITSNSNAQHQYDVVLLKSGTDGINQITQTLAGMHDVSAVHIISHGADGEVQLGGATLNFDSLLNNASHIKGWGQALAPGADILIYGCDVAEYADGKALVKALSQLTGADVAASEDLTGAANKGGNWTLEYDTGHIDAALAISATEQATWNGVLQGVAVGGETLVNTTTAGVQQTSPTLNGKSVAVAPDGSYVVVWAGNGTQAGNVDNSGVYLQRYSAAGVKVGGETLVNATTAGAQQNASIAMDANGNFVIVWDGNGSQAGNVDNQGVFFQRYNAAGVKQGTETRVNTTTAGAQQNASVAMDTSGNFVIAWDGNGAQAGNVDGVGVFFQRYNAAGVKQGGETLVNTTTAGNQQRASVATDPSGNFVVAWDGNGAQAGNVDGVGVFFQRYNAAGVKQGAETLVNTTTAGNQQNASVAIDANGNFVVAWDGNGAQAGNVDAAGVFFQLYNATGVKQGGESLANQTTANTQQYASVAMDASGNFVVSWTSTSQPGDVAATTAVVKRDFNADGTANGGETLVNTTTAGAQGVSSVAMNAYDQYVVVWQGNGTGDAAGVFSQRYAAALIVDTANDTYDSPFAQSTITISQLLNSKGPDGFISLREAIDAADNTANTGAPDRIYFRIPGAGTHTINLSSALPNITEAVTIDGYSQTGASVNTQAIGDNAVLLIELNGAGAGGSSGLVLAAGSSGSTLRGLVINRFTSSAIRILASSNNTVVGNFLGTNAAGTVVQGNQVGLYITSTGPNSTNNTVGGTTAADRNVISGNTVDGIQIFGAGTSGNVVLGNYIGLDVTGTVDLGNANQGVAVFNQATNNTIGGTAAGTGNVISGNNGRGVAITTAGATGNVVQGNLIGTNAAGTGGVGNSKEGIYIDTSAANNTIGGTTAGAGNTIAYNTLDGVALGSSAGTGNSILSNSIYSNGGQGIDLAANGVSANDVGDGDAGANNLQNFPTVTAVTVGGGNTTVTGTFNSVANTNFRLEFFASSSVDPLGYGEGQVYLGFLNVTTNASGDLGAPFSYVKAGYTLPAGWAISATATRANATYTTFTDTSEFSGAVAPPLAVDDAYSVNEDSTLVVGSPTTNLANWWKFDDGGASQTVVDSGSLANNGTRGSTAGVDASDPTWMAGYVGTNALSFDGSSDYVTTTSTLAKAASSFTLSAWFQTNTTSGQQILLWEGHSGGNAYGDPSNTPADSEMSLSVGTYNQDDNITFHLGYDVPGGGADPIYIVSNSTFTDTTAWHNATVTVSDLGGGVFGASLYVDGVLQGSDTGVQNDRSAWGALQIGAPGAATRHFDGQVDDVRVYDAALSPAQVQNIVQTGVLQNDSDADSMPIKVNTSVVTGPANGTLNISPSGSFIYTPNANFNGIDTFTYKATDGSNDSNLATVTITVNPINDAPAGTSNTVTALEDTAYTFATSDFGFTDPLDAGGAAGANALAAVKITTLPAAGTLTDNGVAVVGGQFVSVSDISTGKLKFTPAANANGAGYASFTFQVQDDGGTSSGGVDTDATPNTMTINVTAVNDAPTATNLSAAESYTEDTPLNLTNIVVSDVDSANVTAILTLSNVAAGSLTTATSGAVTSTYNALTGVWTASGALADVNTLLAGVSFTPALNFNSTFTIATSVGDGVAAPITGSKAMTGTPVNDAPALATGSVLAYTENQAATAISTLLTVTDSDNATLASGTVSITANFVSGEDVLGFTNVPATMGNIAGVYNAATGVMTLTSSGATATTAQWQAALRAVNYSNSSNSPSVLARTVSYTVNDGAINSNTLTGTINVTAVNDAPVLDASKTPVLVTINEDAGAPVGAVGTLISSLVDFASPAGQVDNVTDADSGALLGIAITAADATNGSWWFSTNGGTSWTALGVPTAANSRLLSADANTRIAFQPNANFNGTVASAITFRAWDQTTGSNGALASTAASGGTTAFSAATDTAAITVTAVNDSPTATNMSAAETYTEDTALNLINVVVSDVDSPNVTVTFTLSDVTAGSFNTATAGSVTSTFVGGVWSASGAIANVNTLLAGLTFTPAANYNANFTVATSVSDGVAPALTGAKAFTGTPVNDAPVLDASKTPVLGTTNEDAGAPVGAVGTLVSSLVDFASPSGQMDNVTDADSGALLGIAITAADATNGSWWFSTNGGTTWAALGVPTAANSRLLSADANTRIAFQPNANFNGTVASAITFRAWDQTSGSNGALASTAANGAATAFSATTDAASITVNAVNDPPVLATGSVLAYTENQAATAINSVLTVGDVDNPTLASATVSITSNFASGQDVLGFTNVPATMGNIAGVYNAATGVMTLTSAGATATTAQWQAALRAVNYSNLSDSPAVLARTVSYTVNDGTVNSNVVTSTINVTAVNDAPVLATSSVLAYTENQAATAINTVLTVNDADNATLSSGTVSITTNFAAGQDVLGFTNVPATMGNIAGAYNAATGVMTLTSAGATATLAQWQAALQSVTYSNSSDTPSALARTVSYRVNDGALNSNIVTSTINVTAVNDAPALATGSVLAYTENQAATAINTGITTTDLDNATLASGTVSITTNFAAGQDVLGFTNVPATMGNIAGAYNAATGVMTLTSAGATATLAQWQAAFRAVTYSNSSDTPSALARTVSYRVNDGALNSNIVTSTINVTAVNDAPALATGSVLAYTENQAATAINTGITTTDLDNATLASGTVSITTNFAAGQDVLGFTNVPATMGNIAGAYNAATGVMTLTSAGATATLAQWQAAFRAVTYSNSSDNPSVAARTVSYTVNDGTVNSNTVTSTINVTAVNDAPVNAVPAAQTTSMNSAITLSGVNAIVVNDMDANAGLEQVTLSVSNGTLSLGSVAGLSTVTGDGTGSVVFSGTLANLNNALNGLTYTPNLNYAGADTLTVGSDDQGNTGTGGALISNSTVNITVLANQAPTLSATANNPSFQEAAGLGTQAPAVNPFSAANASTVEAGQSVIGMTFTVGGLLDGASERLVVDGTVIALGSNSSGTTATNAMSYNVSIVAGTATVSLVSGGGVGAGNIGTLINGITYQNTNTDNPSAGNRVFTLTQIQDSGGTVSGGVDNTTLAITSTINVTAVNDAPVLATGSTLNYTENQAAAAINTLVAVNDVDNTTLASASVSITGNFSSGEDVLGFVNNPATMGNIAGAYNAATGVMSLSSAGASATLAQWQAALQSVSYSNSSDNPSVAPRTVSYTVNDATANSNTIASTINVTAVNDAPVLATGSTLNYTENQAAAAINTLVAVNDVDNTTLASASVSITGNFASGEDVLGFVNNPATMGNIAGAYNAATGVMSLSSAGASATLAQWQVALQSVSYSNSSDNPSVAPRTVSYTVNDTAANSNTITSTVNVTAVNDAPVMSAGATTVYTENAPAVVIDNTITIADVDDTQLSGATITISTGLTVGDVLGFVNTASISGSYNAGTGVLTLSGTDSLANYQAALRSVTFFSTSDDPTVASANRSVGWQVTDANSDGTGAQSSVVVTSTINVSAVNDAPVMSAGATTGYSENAPAVVIDNTVTIADVDDTLLSGATVTISAGLTAGDVLGFTNTASISGSYNAGTGVLTLSGTDTLANYQTALRSVTYSSTSDDPTNNATAPSRSIAWQVTDANSDGTGAQSSAVVTSTVNVTAVADAPVMSAGATTGYTENAPAVVIDNTITIADVDDTQIAGATVTISAGLTAGDVLGFTNTASISGSYNAGTGVLTLSGTDTLANYQTALRSVTYSSTSDGPTATSASRSIAWQVTDANSDGTGAQSSAVVTSTINVTSVNDAPIGTNNTVTTNEDTVYTFGIVDFGFTDPNDSPANSLLAVTITTLPTAGQLTNNGIAVSAGQTVTLADITGGLLVFAPAADANGAGYAGFSFQVQDDGGTSNGGVDLDVTPRTLTIDVTSINDAPLGTNNTVTTNEDTAYTFGVVDFGFSDPNDSPANSLLAVTITTLPSAGQLTNNGIAVTAGQTITLADITGGLLVFAPAADANGAGYAAFTFQVQDDGGTASGGVDLDVTPRSMTIDVTAVNDAPQGADNSVNTLENTDYIFGVADFGLTDPQDSPSDALLAVRINALPGAGTLLDNGVAVSAGQFVSAADIAANLLVFTPTPGTNGVGYANFSFQVQDDGGTANGGVDLDPASHTMTLNVFSVNDAPVGTNNTVTTNEDTAYTFGVADFGFTDPNDIPANSLLAVTITTLPSAGQLTNNGIAVSAGQTITLADITGGLLVFAPAADANGAGYAAFTFQVQDDGGTINGGVDIDATPNTITINVTAVNDAPTATNLNAAESYTEDTPLNLTNIVVSDVDSANVTAILTLSNVAAGSLTTATSGAVTSTYNALTGVWTASGALADVNTLLAGVSFTPALDFNSTFTIATSVSDGVAAPITGSKAMTGTPVNDAPTGTNNTVTTNENTAYTFGAVDFGFTDPIDSPANSLLTVTITTLPSAGQLTNNGIAVSAGQTITLADITGGQLVFAPAASANGAGYAAFTFQVQDNGGTAGGGVDLDVTPRTITVNVTAVNVTPPVVVTPPPVVVPPPPSPPSGGNNPGQPGKSGGDSDNQRAIAPEVVHSPGRIVAKLNEMADDHPAEGEARRGQAAQPKATLNDFRQRNADGPAASAPTITMASLAFTSSKPADWTTQSAFPNAGEEAPHDQIQILMDSVKMGGLALSVGVVWWASRISGLLGSLLASAPAWRHIDPLPVVGRDDDEDEAEWLEPDDRDADANELAVSLVLEGSHRAVQ